MAKKVTSRDVAKAAGVSQSLVSLVLNNVTDKKIKPETRKLVLQTARELNYTIDINARNMKNGRAGAIGLLSAWDAGSFVFPPIIKGIQRVCSENDLGVVICTGKEGNSGQKDYISYFLQNRIDALIYVSYVGVTFDGVIEELAQYDIPFVCIIGARDIPSVSCVDVSFLESGYIAGKHLVDMGYENIGYILVGEQNNLIYAERERLEGCRSVVLHSGREFTEINALSEYRNDSGALLAEAERIVASGDFDAIVGCSYNCFIMLKAAAKLGVKVPEKLGVISLDNEMYTPYLFPSLTTIDEPLEEMAENAMNLLLESMKGEKLCRKLEIAPKLSVRESTSRKQQ